MADDKVNVNIGFDQGDLAKMEAEKLRLEQVGLARDANGNLRYIANGRFAPEGAAAAAVIQNKVGKSATPGQKPSWFARAMLPTGNWIAGPNGALNQPILGTTDSKSKFLTSDPSTGGWNRSQFASAPISSSPVRAMLYRVRAIAAGNPLALARSALAVWLLKQTGDAVGEILTEAAKDFNAAEPAKNVGAVQGATINSLRKEGSSAFFGLSKGIGTLLSLISNSVHGFAMVPWAIQGQLPDWTNTGGSKERYKAMGKIGEIFANASATNDAINYFFDVNSDLAQFERANANRLRASNDAWEVNKQQAAQNYINFKNSGYFNELVYMGLGTRNELNAFFDGAEGRGRGIQGRLLQRAAERAASAGSDRAQFGDQGGRGK